MTVRQLWVKWDQVPKACDTLWLADTFTVTKTIQMLFSPWGLSDSLTLTGYWLIKTMFFPQGKFRPHTNMKWLKLFMIVMCSTYTYDNRKLVGIVWIVMADSPRLYRNTLLWSVTARNRLALILLIGTFLWLGVCWKLFFFFLDVSL